MLNTKKLLTKMLKRTMSSGSITFPFTVPNDGILTVIVTTVSAGGAAAYVLLRNQNNTDIGAWSGIANGTRNTLTFGVKKGDTIKVAASANMNADAYAYTLLPIFGGGYFLTRFMSTFSRLAERWWEYVEHEKAVNENTLETDGQRSKDKHPVRQLQEKEWNSIRRLLHSRGHDSQYELPGSWNASDRVSSVRHILRERWNERRECWRVLRQRRRQNRSESIQWNNNVFLVPNSICDNGLTTISERGWAYA